MFNKHRLFFLINSLSFFLYFCTFLSAEDKYFSLSEKWSVQLPASINTIKLYDINKNNSQDIIIGTSSTLHIASDSAREVITSSDYLPYGISCIEAGDLDQNGVPEILAGMSDGVFGSVCIFTDAVLDSYTITPGDTFIAVTSLEAVPMEESTIVYLAGYLVTTGYPVHNYVGLVYVGTGYLSNLEMIYGGDLIEHLEFVDLDGDAEGELILSDFYAFNLVGVHGTEASVLILVELHNTLIQHELTLFSFHGVWDPIYEGGFTSLEIGNCDDDSSLEIIGSAFADTCFPSKDSSCVNVLSVADGLNKVEQWRSTYFGTDNIIRGIAILDFNDDGMNEVLVAHQNAPMELLNGKDGSKIAESDSSFTVGQFACGDVDGDGEKEIVIGEGYILRVFEVDFTTDVPEGEKDLSHNNFLVLSQNYPNPFNHTTLIRFEVNSSQSTVHGLIPTTLKIYNILGQKIKTLLDEEKIPGNYQVNWNGKDDKGKTVPSGIYFYQLTVGKYSESRKMLFLK